jgi:hypothetical protein
MTDLFALMRPLLPDHDAEAPARERADEAPPSFIWTTVSLEAEMIAVIDAPPHPGEHLASSFGRKELMLGDLFARLTVVEARELHRRFTRAAADDALALRFNRFIPERRARLLAFLADARRREALQPRTRLGGHHG